MRMLGSDQPPSIPAGHDFKFKLVIDTTCTVKHNLDTIFYAKATLSINKSATKFNLLFSGKLGRWLYWGGATYTKIQVKHLVNTHYLHLGIMRGRG